MASFKIGPRFLTFQKTKYFIKGAHMVTIGSLGKKRLGGLEPRDKISGVEKLEGFNKERTSVQIVSIKKSNGGGNLEFSEPTDTLEAEVKALGSSSKVIIAELEFFDVLDQDLIDLLSADQDNLILFNNEPKLAVADSVVNVKKFREISASDFQLKLEAGFTLMEVLKMDIGVSLGTSASGDLTLSEGTVAAYRLLTVTRKNGSFDYHRDVPGL